MPITPVINGYVYNLESSVDNDQLNTVLTALAKLKTLTQSVKITSPSIPTPSQPGYSWHNAYTESHEYQQYYGTLVDNKGSSNADLESAIDSVLDVFTNSNISTPYSSPTTDSFLNIYTATFGGYLSTSGSSATLDDSNYLNRLNLVSGILYMRNHLEDVIESAYATLKTQYDQADNIVLRPSLQNYVLYEYAFAAEDLISSQLNTLGNTVIANNTALEALNKFGQVQNKNVELDMKLALKSSDYSEILDDTVKPQIKDEPPPTPSPVAYVTSAIDQLQNDALGFISNFTTETDPTGSDGTYTFTFAAEGTTISLGANNSVIAESPTNLFTTGQKLLISTGTSFTDALYQVTGITNTTLTVNAINDTSETPSDFENAMWKLSDKKEYLQAYAGFYDYDTVTQFSDTVVDSFMDILQNIELYNYINYSASTDTDGIKWFNDLGVHSDIDNAVTNVQYLNDTKKQELNETYYIYTKFLQSAAAVMNSLDTTISASAQRIRSRS
jgi:hypothetical protein